MQFPTPYRGFMLDTARKFFPRSCILRLLDLLHIHGYNAFHWHLTDSESFPIQWNRHGGRLWKLGAFRNEEGQLLSYSHEDICAIISYAQDLKICVIPEFEMPAHCTVWQRAFPNAVLHHPCLPNSAPEFNLADAAIITLLKDFIADMLELFSACSHFHLGGDEVAMVWPDTNPHQTLQRFYAHDLLSLLQTNNRSMIVWDDLVSEKGLVLPSEMTIQVWRDTANLMGILSSGHKVILSTSPTWYVGNATPEKLQSAPIPDHPNLLGTELVWFTSPSDDPHNLEWLEPLIAAQGQRGTGPLFRY